MSNVSPICVDAGILVRLLTAQDDGTIRDVWGRWQAERRTLVAPRLLRFEVANALHRMRGAGDLSEEATKEAMQTTLDLPVVLADEPDLHASALGFAAQFDLPAAYDAHYLALAARENAELWTTDRRLANKVRPALPWVRLVGE